MKIIFLGKIEELINWIIELQHFPMLIKISGVHMSSKVVLNLLKRVSPLVHLPSLIFIIDKLWKTRIFLQRRSQDKCLEFLSLERALS